MKKPLLPLPPLLKPKPISREEKEAYDEDVRLAMALLCGIRREGKRLSEFGGLSEFEFLSRNTKPTENEAREALSRVLLTEDAPPIVLHALAAVFAPNGQSPLCRSNLQKVVLQRLNQGHSNPHRDWQIAFWVDALRRDGLSYNDATEKVAELADRSTDQIKRICGKVRLGRSKPPRTPRKPRR
jgi:hypothetical protein